MGTHFGPGLIGCSSLKTGPILVGFGGSDRFSGWLREAKRKFNGVFLRQRPSRFESLVECRVVEGRVTRTFELLVSLDLQGPENSVLHDTALLLQPARLRQHAHGNGEWAAPRGVALLFAVFEEGCLSSGRWPSRASRPRRWWPIGCGRGWWRARARRRRRVGRSRLWVWTRRKVDGRPAKMCSYNASRPQDRRAHRPPHGHEFIVTTSRTLG
jgi:hypothetical protein